MAVHDRGDTLLVLLLGIGSVGILLPLMAFLRLTDRWQTRKRSSTGKIVLCDCCGAHNPPEKVSTRHCDLVDREVTLCIWGKSADPEDLEYALETPMYIKYWTPTL